MTSISAVGLCVLLLSAAGGSPAAANRGLTISATSQPATATQPAAPASDDATAVQLDKLKHKLAGMLTATGQLKPDVSADTVLAVANEADQLADNINRPAQQLVADQVQMRADDALARHAARQTAAKPSDMLVASLRMHQLRSVAQQTREIPAAGAKTIGDYWLVAADLLNLHLSGYPLAQHQARAIARLSQFVRAHPADAKTHALTAQGQAVRWALLQLDRQAGRTAQTKRMIDQLVRSQAVQTPQQLLAISWARDEIALIGRSVHCSVQTVSGQSWTSADHRGQPALLVFFDKASEKTTALLPALRQGDAKLTSGGLNLVALDVGDRLSWVKHLPVPCSIARLNADNPLLGQLHITRLPTLILLNSSGDIESIGHTLAVLDQTPKTQPTTHTRPQGEP